MKIKFRFGIGETVQVSQFSKLYIRGFSVKITKDTIKKDYILNNFSIFSEAELKKTKTQILSKENFNYASINTIYKINNNFIKLYNVEPDYNIGDYVLIDDKKKYSKIKEIKINLLTDIMFRGAIEYSYGFLIHGKLEFLKDVWIKELNFNNG